jgi:hypothetical protein
MRIRSYVFALYLGCCIVMVSCKTKKPTVFIEHQVGEIFNIQIPTFMHASKQVSPFRTVMQYENDSAKEFLMVFDTSRDGLHENTLRMYYDSIISQIDMDSARLKQPQFLMVNKDSAYKTEFSGTINGVKVYNDLETIATPDRFFTILVWGKLDNKEQLKEDMDRILSSFTDISHQKI